MRSPRGATGPLPTLVEYAGYGGGRGYPEETLLWASAGFAHNNGIAFLLDASPGPEREAEVLQAAAVCTALAIQIELSPTRWDKVKITAAPAVGRLQSYQIDP
ncbi:acetylxylan esterase [Arthrobacter sp. PM3]|uniref:acetylxylan esterase n=1 Tax=Arthrobacter sp. PM3 TaxID=2017685 RepID=UPI001ABF4F92